MARSSLGGSFVLVLVCASLALAGCGDEPLYVRSAILNEHHEDLFVRVWDSEYPESGPTPGVARVKETGEIATNWLTSCINPTPTGYYLKVTVHRFTPGLDPESPSSIDEAAASKRWDGLKCGEEYTIIVHEGPQLALYKCDCEHPGDEVGRTPLPTKPA